MRKYTKANGTFYYPEQYVSLVDTDEVKIIVENPAGYVEGDLVRMFYAFSKYNIKVGVNTFEMFSPLVKDGSILRAIFYLPLSVEFTTDDTSFNPNLKLTDYYIKNKGSTDFDIYTNLLDTKSSYFFLTTMGTGVLSNPIPVFFFSERGAGLFANKILNRQSWVADTNFSSVAIRQDKFNPYDLEIGGRNLLLGTTSEVVTYTKTDDAHWWRQFFLPTEIANFGILAGTYLTFRAYIENPTKNAFVHIRFVSNTSESYLGNAIVARTSGWSTVTMQVSASDLAGLTSFYVDVRTTEAVPANAGIGSMKLERGSKATDWTHAPEDYEVTEVVTGADLAGGLAKFDSSYAFKLLDDSEWVTKKLVCPENYIQLFWGEPRSETRFSFWFKIKEIEKSSEAWGEVEHYRELRAGTDVKERRKDVTKYRFPKTKLRLTSGVFRQDIIDKLKGIAHSPTIYKYNPYTKLNEGRGVIAQVTELSPLIGLPTPQLGTGHFKLNYIYTSIYSNTIEELVNSPESVFDLEFSFKGDLHFVYFLQNRDDWSTRVVIQPPLIADNWLKKTYTNSIVIDRGKKVKPALVTSTPQTPASLPEIKDIYIKGSLGAIEDVEVEIATMNIIPRQDGESEMELTVISDDFRKPDYLYF